MSHLNAKRPLRSWSLNQLVTSTSNATEPTSCTFPTCHSQAPWYPQPAPPSASHDRRFALLPEFFPINNYAMVILYYRFFKLGKRWRIKSGIFYLKMMCFQYGWQCWWDDRNEEALLSGGKKCAIKAFRHSFFPHIAYGQNELYLRYQLWLLYSKLQTSEGLQKQTPCFTPNKESFQKWEMCI